MELVELNNKNMFDLFKAIFIFCHILDNLFILFGGAQYSFATLLRCAMQHWPSFCFAFDSQCIQVVSQARKHKLLLQFPVEYLFIFKLNFWMLQRILFLRSFPWNLVRYSFNSLEGNEKQKKTLRLGLSGNSFQLITCCLLHNYPFQLMDLRYAQKR